ncbi:MAG TPA: KH domain-containing protein [Candidatus Nanoarchaeia archaeon]|nr:hypothetical protein [uncultured archaeon]
MKDLLLYLTTNFVKNPKNVQVEEKVGASGEINLELSVHPDDMGLVIGKGGKVIKSLRNILRTKAILEGRRVNLVLTEQN